MFSKYLKFLGVGTVFSILSMHAIALTAEQALGEYWKDPIFGQAAASFNTQIEVLNGRIWPSKFEVPIGKNARFVFVNKTNQAHLLAFTRNEKALLEDDQFKSFVSDEVFHSQEKRNQPSGHHSHAETSTDDAQDIVKNMSQRPTVFIEAGDQKEILIKFDDSDPVQIICVLDDHNDAGYRSTLTPVPLDQLKTDALQQIY